MAGAVLRHFVSVAIPHCPAAQRRLPRRRYRGAGGSIDGRRRNRAVVLWICVDGITDSSAIGCGSAHRIIERRAGAAAHILSCGDDLSGEWMLSAGTVVKNKISK